MSNSLRTGADLEGGGGRTPFPSGIRPPADPKGPPFDTFSENVYQFESINVQQLVAQSNHHIKGPHFETSSNFLKTFEKKTGKVLKIERI